MENVFGGDLTGSWRNEFFLETKFYTQSVIFKFNDLFILLRKCELNMSIPRWNPHAVGRFAATVYFDL